MKPARELPAAIAWHEGMRLAPQHFQQMAGRQEALLGYHMGNAMPFFWGIRRLKFAQGQLAEGLLRILELEAILPDGLVVTYSEDSTTALEIPLDPLRVQLQQSPMMVHLVVPVQSGADNGNQGRYRSVAGEPIADEISGQDPIDVPRLAPHLSLRIEEFPPARFVSIPLARVQCENNSFSLVRYLPPMPVVPVRSPLGSQLAGICNALREKAFFVAERIRATATLQKSTALTELEHALRALTAGLPPLEAALYAEQSAPCTLYVLLTGVAGHLSGLSTGFVPPLFPAYRHEDVLACFDPVIEFITKMLNNVQQSYKIVSFERQNDSFQLRFNPQYAAKNRALIGVRGPAGVLEAELNRWIENALIMGASQHLSLQERRMQGAERVPIIQDEDLGLVARPGVALFALTLTDKIVKNGELLIISPPAESNVPAQPIEIVLYVPT